MRNNYEIINYKGFAWIVLRKIPDRTGVDIAHLKKIWHADMCLRKNGLLYFVEIIEDAEIIEETTSNNE